MFNCRVGKGAKRRAHHVQSDGLDTGGHVAGAPLPTLRQFESYYSMLSQNILYDTLSHH